MGIPREGEVGVKVGERGKSQMPECIVYPDQNTDDVCFHRFLEMEYFYTQFPNAFLPISVSLWSGYSLVAI